jgi:hypothetical protein
MAGWGGVEPADHPVSLIGNTGRPPDGQLHVLPFLERQRLSRLQDAAFVGGFNSDGHSKLTAVYGASVNDLGRGFPQGHRLLTVPTRTSLPETTVC